jgi:hypothetical protein
VFSFLILNELLQVRHILVDRSFDLEDTTIILHKAADYKRWIVSQGNRNVHGDEAKCLTTPISVTIVAAQGANPRLVTSSSGRNKVELLQE